MVSYDRIPRQAFCILDYSNSKKQLGIEGCEHWKCPGYNSRENYSLGSCKYFTNSEVVQQKIRGGVNGGEMPFHPGDISRIKNICKIVEELWK